MFKSLYFRRLYIPGVLIVCAVALVVGLLGAYRLHQSNVEQARRLLRHSVLLVTDLLRDDLASGNLPQLRAKVADLSNRIGYRITVIGPDPRGTVLADSEADPAGMASHRTRPEVVMAFSSGEGWDIRRSETIHDMMLYYARRVAVGEDVAYIRVAIHVNDLYAHLHTLYLSIAVATGLCMLLAAVVAYFIARRQAAPVVEATQFADAVSRGNLEHRILRNDPGELGVLARSLNRMADSFTELLGQAEKDKSELSAVLSSMNEGVIAADSSHKILFANEAAGRLLQFDHSAAVGKALWQIIRQEPILRSIEDQSRTAARRQFLCPVAGSQLEIALCPFTHARGDTGLIIVVRDVTQAVRYQDLRREFVANVSHELRTPLSVIKGYIETLRDGAIEDQQKRDEYLQTVERHANQLGNLVNDLLELSRLEHQASVPRAAIVDLGAIVRRAAELLKEAADRKRHRIAITAPTQSPPVLANSDYLERAVVNLLDNAIKYTPAGGQITLSVASSDTHAIIEVVDNGIGIPPADLPRVFERFYRVDRSRSREMGGTGLGLAIVKHIVQSHGGQVEVESRPNEGSRFRILLPLAMEA